MIVYKLLRVRKDGSISPLFINKGLRIQLNTWLPAEAHKTPGFAFRPGWHCTAKPVAPHLSTKGRKWFKAEIQDYIELKRPVQQGGVWYLANRINILEPL